MLSDFHAVFGTPKIYPPGEGTISQNCYCPILKKVMLFEVIEDNKNSKENGYFSISLKRIRI